MSIYRELGEKIRKKEAKICIVGLGYVGLPLVLAFLEKGFFVYGLDTNSSRINRLKKGISYIVDVDFRRLLFFIKKGKFFPTTEKKIILQADVIIICVPTPLRKVKIPDISYIVSAAKAIKEYLRKGHLVILESTSFPTTTREVVFPILKKSGLKEEDFFLCFSPERVNPGDKKFRLEKISKIVGGVNRKSSRLAKLLYSQIIKKVYVVPSPEIAETAKLLENTFRLVNIALVNEFALLCHKLKIDVWGVIKAAETKPFGFMAFWPGPGIGGHCIPCDPLYLSWKAKKVGFRTRMIDLASFVNRYMPKYVVNRIINLLKKKEKNPSRAKVLVLGVTYKEDVKDLRESPALEIIEELKRRIKKVEYFDPLIPYLKIGALNLKRIDFKPSRIKEYDCVVIVTAHTDIDYNNLRENARLIFDTRNVYKKNFDNVEKL
ncbi:MAG: UDP-N-acetyl-D-glucosamine dehydrogenase [Candidatus Omnitrophota bacterium]|nr:MAG: UDP-N-acetyl-D-glucosamine dehydrogenase [Candidatus Omnitrophota bacterium]